MSTLAAMVLGRQVFVRTGKRYGLSGQEMRVLAAISVLSEGGTLPTYKGILAAMGVSDIQSAWKPVHVLVGRGYVTQARVLRQLANTKLSVRLEPAGALVVGELNREMRQAIADAGKIVGAKVRRKHVRKPKPTT